MTCRLTPQLRRGPPGHLTTDPMLRQRMALQRGNQGNQGNNNGTGATTGPLNVNSPYGPNIIDGQSLDGIKFYYVDELVAVKEPQAPKQGSMSGFATHHFLPRGYRIPVILIDRINTSPGNPACGNGSGQGRGVERKAPNPIWLAHIRNRVGGHRSQSQRPRQHDSGSSGQRVPHYRPGAQHGPGAGF